MGVRKRTLPHTSGVEPNHHPRTRGIALAIVIVVASLMCYTVWLLGRPLYWRVYADFINRYESDAEQSLIQELQKDQPDLQHQLPGEDLGGHEEPHIGGGDGAAAGGAGGRGGGDETRGLDQQQQEQHNTKRPSSGTHPKPLAEDVEEKQQPESGAQQQQQQFKQEQQVKQQEDKQQEDKQQPEEQEEPKPQEKPQEEKPREQQQQREQEREPPVEQDQQQQPADHEQQQQQQHQKPGKQHRAGDDNAEDAAPSPSPRVLSAKELEEQRARAREKQWEDEWWRQYQKSEKDKKAKQEKEKREKELQLVKKYNHTLTKELVQSLAVDGYLVVTWANYHYTDFALSWVYHVQQVGIKNYIVGAMDDSILVSLAKRKIHTFNMAAGLTTGDFGWGSKTFAKMGRKKINLIARFLKLGVKVIISDVDVLWLRNPIPFFKRYPGADILTSTDHLQSTVGAAEQLERYPDAGSAFNIGIMMFGRRSLPFVEKWIELIESDDTIWDQNAFNDLIRAGQVIQEDDPNHYFLGDKGKLKVGVLPVAFFCSGHVYFTQQMHKTLGVEPYAVHATFQFSGTPGKRHRFRDAGLWLEDSAYYNPPGGFITFDPHIPKELLKKAGPRTGQMDVANTLGHFDLVNYQLKQLRQAFALATILGRAVILPELWCGLDRYWAPHSGTLPGSSFKLPFVCPADHILDLENGMARDLNEIEFGPNIGYRESSFLKHPALPDLVHASVVHVMPCKKGTVGCATGDNPATLEFNRLFMQEHLDSEHIMMALSSVSSISVLNFTSIDRSFGNFTAPEDYTKFYKRLQHYGAVWCCVDAHPGHVHYDLWWDTPRTDKFGRVWDKEPWKPLTGP